MYVCAKQKHSHRYRKLWQAKGKGMGEAPVMGMGLTDTN